MKRDELIAALMECDRETVFLVGKWDAYRGYVELRAPVVSGGMQETILVDDSCGYWRDVTNAERERDIEAVIL